MVEQTQAELKKKMDGTVAALTERLAMVRTGTANAALLSTVVVSAYGSQMKIHELASVTAPDPRLLVVSPWDRSLVSDIEKAIQAANLGFNPQSDGAILRIPIPPLTEERRKEIVKGVHKMCEDSKVAIRNIRRDANDHLKKAEKDGKISEDDHKRAQDQVQKTTDEFIAKVDQLAKRKEDEVMKV